MGFWMLLIYLVITFSILFILLCVSPHGSGPIAATSRIFFVHIPNWSYSLTIKLLGIEGTAKVKYYAMFIFTEPNPFFQMVYLALSIGGYTIYYIYGFPYIPNPYVQEFHMYIGSFLYFIALLTFISASIVSPGIIDKQNLKFHLDLFQYDNVLYKSSDCSTCKIQKPARSKHCSVCKFCIGKHDHHCIWINQCVGYSNYKYFLAFILSHALICFYAGQVGIMILIYIVQKDKLLTTVFVDMLGNEIKGSWMVIFQYMLQRLPSFVFIVVLCLIMGITLGGFFLYHVFMAGQNLTSNERIKMMKLEDNGRKRENIYNLGFWKNINEVLDAVEI